MPRTEHGPSNRNKLITSTVSLLLAAAALTGCGGEKTTAQPDQSGGALDTTTSAPANPSQPESTGTIPEKICYTDPATGEQETQDNAVKMDQAAIEASSVYSEGKCPAAEIIPKGFEIDYDNFGSWESKSEADKDLTRESTYRDSGRVNLFINQLAEGQEVISGEGKWSMNADQWVKYWGERAAVVNAIRNDKSDPRNEEVAYKMAEGLFVPGTNEANFMKDSWDDKETQNAKTFLPFDASSMVVTGSGKPYTMKDGTVIYPIQVKANYIYDNDPEFRKILIAFSPAQHKDDQTRKYTETIKVYNTWVEGVHDFPNIKIVEN